MDFSLTPEQHDLRLRARAFADALLPYEVAAEESGGKVAPEVKAEVRRLAREARLIGGNPVSYTHLTLPTILRV